MDLELKNAFVHKSPDSLANLFLTVVKSYPIIRDQFLIVTRKRGDETVINRPVMKALRRFAVLASLMIGVTSMFAAKEQETPGKGKSSRPNILLIIGDDIGIDATTDMYPGLIDSLVKQYGPSGHNHPNYQMIAGRPSSTPTLNSLAKAGMRFTHAWMNPFCSPTRTSILTDFMPPRHKYWTTRTGCPKTITPSCGT